jgi:hypothetical protein
MSDEIDDSEGEGVLFADTPPFDRAAVLKSVQDYITGLKSCRGIYSDVRVEYDNETGIFDIFITPV